MSSALAEKTDREAVTRSALGLTKLQWLLLDALMKRSAVSYEGLEQVMYGSHPPVDVRASISKHLFALRPVLAEHGVTVKTLYDFGYALPPEGKKKLNALLEAEAA